MNENQRIIANAEISEIVIQIPKGHQHLRTTIKLQSGEELILQEATLANLVRAYVTIKTHPQKEACRLRGQELGEAEKKQGFASWQLIEEQ